MLRIALTALMLAVVLFIVCFLVMFAKGLPEADTTYDTVMTRLVGLATCLVLFAAGLGVIEAFAAVWS